MSTRIVVAHSEVTFVDAINVNNNKMVFSADNHVVIKLLRQNKKFGAKRFIAKYPSKQWRI